MKCVHVCNQCEYRRAQEQCDNHMERKKVGRVHTANMQNDKNNIIISSFMESYYLPRNHICLRKQFLTMLVILHIYFPYVDEIPHGECIFNNQEVSH